MAHGIGDRRFLRIALLAFVGAGLAGAAPAAPGAGSSEAGSVLSPETPPNLPMADEREDFCKLLKILGKPCPEDADTPEPYYLAVEEAYHGSDFEALTPAERDELIDQILVVEDSQSPAPEGVDPVAYDNFMALLDQMLYELGV